MTCLSCQRPSTGLQCEACRGGSTKNSTHLILRRAPVAKPRMTRRDQWQTRPAVARYRAYCDDLRAAAAAQGFTLPDHGAHMVFRIPMPPSWPKRKRAEMDGQPHQQRPDVDNLTKAILDALRPDGDAAVWQLSAEKRWAQSGGVEITVAPIQARAA